MRRQWQRGGRPFCGIFFIAVLAAVLAGGSAWAGASVNIPAGSWIYGEFERLEVKGLIESGLLSTKPFSRDEGLRLVNEAKDKADRAGDRGRAATPVILRLAGEFRRDPDGQSFFKPVERAYAGYLYSDRRPYFPSVNNNGNEFESGHNGFAGFSSAAKFRDTLTVHFTPEYRLDEESSRVRLQDAYVKAGIGPFDFQAGRDAMRWGPGYHGSLLMSNNAEPLDMIRASTAHPVILPWVFGKLGPMRPTLFLARLEEDRDFPRANLLGMRLDFKPTPAFGFALNRVILFGGEGRQALSASDWASVFFATDSAEHSSSPIDGDQILSIEASYIHLNRAGRLPWSGLKLYTEIGAEDSSGETKSPTARAYLFGAYVDEPFRIKDFDLRVEYATTARENRVPSAQWYRHHIYTSGYTYKGRVIGHHMGPDATDLFIRGQYHSSGGMVIGVEADLERSLVHESGKTKRKWLSADASLPFWDGFRLSARAGVEEVSGPADSYTNPVAGINLERSF